jgi:hypothetical protein
MKTPLTPSQARAAVTRHLQRLNNSCNVTQFTAQLHEKDMVELFAIFCPGHERHHQATALKKRNRKQSAAAG